MAIGRRPILAGLLAAPFTARAQTEWPTRPVRIVVPSAAAGSADSAARMLAGRLSTTTGRTFVVENRPGLAGTIGTDHVAKAAPDDHTVVFISTNQAINETLQPRRPYVLLRDLVPVAAVNLFHLVLAVSPTLPVATLAEFIGYARANPGRIDYASSGPGSVFHVSTEVLRVMAGIEIQHVPFRNYNEARTQLMAGGLHAMFDATFTLEPLIRAGRVRGLATTGPTRSVSFPELPAITEVLAGYRSDIWNGLLAPGGTSPVIVERLNGMVNAVLTDPAVIEAQGRIGVQLTPMTPAAFGDFIGREIERLREGVRAAGIVPE